MISLTPPRHQVSISLCLVLYALATTTFLPRALAQPVQRNSVDWILMLDTSMSMTGHGEGAKNIFDKVKLAIKKFIDRAEVGDTITLYRFDQAIEKISGGTRSITNQEDKENLKKSVDQLPALGQHTHTGEVIREALKTTADLKKLPGAANRAVMILLFTDGQEDVADMKKPFRLGDLSVAQKKSDLPYTYLIWLSGEEPNAEINNLLGKLGGEIVPAPDEAAIDRVLNKIPSALPPKVESAEIILSIDPGVIDLGQIEPGQQTDARTLHCRSNYPIRAQLSMEGGDNSGITLIEPHEAFDLKADQTADIPVRLATAGGLADGAHAAKLVMLPVDRVPNANLTAASATAQFSTLTVPVWRKALKWLVIALALTAVVLLLVSLRQGKMPGEIWRDLRGRNYLEGELEIIRPRPAQYEQGLIALRELQRERLQLSPLLPPNAAGAADAELLTVRKDGAKLVRIRSLQGSVRVNKIEVVAAELYNGDIIEVGDARLRFNSLQERPSNLDESE